MASAPRPGAQRQQEAATSRWRVTVKGETLEVPTEVTIKEKFAVRAATGVGFSEFFGATPTSRSKFDLDSLCVLWWLARRHNGEPNLLFEKHLADWPTDLDADDLDLEHVTDDGEATDNPES